jgi:thiamine monophosphate synthase
VTGAGVATTGLPRLLVLTDRLRCPGDLIVALAASVAAGARAVVLREKDLAAGERLELATEVASLLAPVDGLLILASGPPPPPGSTPVRQGVHLAAADPELDGPADIVVGRSCHDAAEVTRAVGAGVAYVTVSPVFPSASKPGYGPPLGTVGLAAMASAAARVPVFALGGVTPGAVAACLAAGAHGVAVMGGIMAADDPGEATADLLAALDAATEEA